jgi:protein-tyrosine phosphatase
VTVLGEQGIDISGHRSRPVTADEVAWADLVLAMSPSHLAALEDFDVGHKAALITDFLEGEAAGQGVADPFGGSLDDYRRTYQVLAAAVGGLLDRLEPILAP